MKIIGVIPARYSSSRFPGKPLAEVKGKPMIVRVYEQAKKVGGLAAVVVATDDQRIADCVRDHGGEVVMTKSDHPSGTDRCLEAVQNLNMEVDAVINIQGDEPFIHPESIDELVQLISKPEVEIGTLVKQIEDLTWLDDPNKVKVVMDKNFSALYFSRSGIPFDQNPGVGGGSQQYFKHIGMYAYKLKSLEAITRMPISSLEKTESLEQLRWLENGIKIHCGITRHESPSVDTPEDLNKINSSSFS